MRSVYESFQRLTELRHCGIGFVLQFEMLYHKSNRQLAVDSDIYALNDRANSETTMRSRHAEASGILASGNCGRLYVADIPGIHPLIESGTIPIFRAL